MVALPPTPVAGPDQPENRSPSTVGDTDACHYCVDMTAGVRLRFGGVVMIVVLIALVVFLGGRVLGRHAPNETVGLTPRPLRVIVDRCVAGRVLDFPLQHRPGIETSRCRESPPSVPEGS
jgi:hypothetical protein